MPEAVTTTAPEAKTGFFGKLPKHGDFLTRRLPRAFTDPWDRWLQNAIADSREQLAEEWLNIYLTSPIWRFALSSGLCGDKAWTGLLMPSVDRVGRYFPLTIAAPLDNGCSLMGLVADNEAWFNRCEELALSALEEDFELEAFDREVEALGLPSLQPGLQPLGQHRTAKPAWHIDLASMETGVTSLGQALLSRMLSAPCLWWTHGSERIRPSLLVTEGFPPIEAYAGLLDGKWMDWGWGHYGLEAAGS